MSSNLPSSKEEAIAIGSKRYFPGKLCKESHTDGWYTNCSKCVRCVLNRVLSRRNADVEGSRIREREASKRYSQRHPEKRKRSRNLWLERNSELAKEIVRKSSQKWYWSNWDKARAANKKWIKDNAEYVRAKNAAREALVLRSIPQWVDAAELEAIVGVYKLAKEKSRSTGVRHEVDHIVPLRGRTVCGLHCLANLRVITANENTRKGNRHWPDMP